ncbi:MAG: response regulator transcription factor [Burkholderiales bacterium]|nr:response regulator transcription factor [Burkholderiales bacterium]
MELPVIRIIDDNEVMRKSWIFLLEDESGWEVKAYEDAQDFLEHDDFEKPGAILLDVRMPKMSGLELQEYLQQISVTLPIIFISGHGDIDMAVHVLKRGAVDFLQKPVDDERLIEALHMAVQKDLQQRKKQSDNERLRSQFDTLTTREKEVIMLAAKGLMNKVIAGQLEISERTVQIHRGVGSKKLGAKTSVDLMQILLRLGIEKYE